MKEDRNTGSSYTPDAANLMQPYFFRVSTFHRLGHPILNRSLACRLAILNES